MRRKGEERLQSTVNSHGDDEATKSRRQVGRLVTAVNKVAPDRRRHKTVLRGLTFSCFAVWLILVMVVTLGELMLSRWVHSYQSRTDK